MKDIFLKNVGEKTGLYFNFPFCIRPCSYCHYINNIKFGKNIIPDDYMEIFLLQLNYVAMQLKNRKLESIYFGGGSPSLLNDVQLGKIINIIEDNNIQSSEVSMEIYPGACNFNYVHNDWFTRYSFGVQSFDSKLLKYYHRNNYNYEIIKEIISEIRAYDINKNINIDLLFQKVINFDDVRKAKLLKPSTITIYPDTRGRGVERLKDVHKSLDIAKEELEKEYNLFAKSKMIFLKHDSSTSNYAKLEYEELGNIIGVGHNSVSFIDDKSYLCQYADLEYSWDERYKYGNRKIKTILMALSTGVKYRYVKEFTPQLASSHLLYDVTKGKNVLEKHNYVLDDDLVYVKECDYLPMLHKIKKCLGAEDADFFGRIIGFGDGDVETLEKVYNAVFVSKKEHKELTKKALPNLNILVEGIDGSGKDTFVELLVDNLKTFFRYEPNRTISVSGQPNSRYSMGIEAKSFVEKLAYDGTDKEILNILKRNRLESEAELATKQGVNILIRGLLTDKASFNKVFNYDNADFGEGYFIKKWDLLIVIDCKAEIADKRISARGGERTWREEIKYLNYFREYYLSYEDGLFKNKLIIINDNLENLKRAAETLAEDIYRYECSKEE